MGAPITEAVTAAMPQITSAYSKFNNKPACIKSDDTIAPALAPIRRAGENTPPKNPKLNETEVANILATKIKMSIPNAYSVANILRTVCVPRPITSGSRAPSTLKAPMPAKVLYNGRELIFCDSVAKKSKFFM